MTNIDRNASAPYLDVINLVLGAVLFVSPWALTYADGGSVAWNAWVFGIIVAVIAAAALVSFAVWEEWLNAAVGLWIAVSPWVFGAAGNPRVLWTHIVVGLAVAALAGWRAWRWSGGDAKVSA